MIDSKILIFTGTFGSGKTLTSVSFTPPNWDGKSKVRRIIVDPELRSNTYKSKDGADHANLALYDFDIVNEGSRLTGPLFFGLMKAASERNWGEKGPPAVVLIDDTALVQQIMQDWWQNQPNAQMTAALYGKERDRALTMNWKPKDPGTTNFFKVLFEEFMLDLKVQGIYLILTSPHHNIWENYGSTERDETGKPKMKIVGKSAKVWDCWQKFADVIWDFKRGAADGTLSGVPNVAMDLFIPKAALPGVPEQFVWPGWTTLWKWNNDRTYVADVTKLKVPAPEYDADSTSAAIKAGKHKLISELEGQATLDQIAEILAGEYAPTYDLNNHEDVKAYILRVLKEKDAKKPAGKKEASS